MLFRYSTTTVLRPIRHNFHSWCYTDYGWKQSPTNGLIYFTIRSNSCWNKNTIRWLLWERKNQQFFCPFKDQVLRGSGTNCHEILYNVDWCGWQGTTQKSVCACVQPQQRKFVHERLIKTTWKKRFAVRNGGWFFIKNHVFIWSIRKRKSVENRV